MKINQELICTKHMEKRINFIADKFGGVGLDDVYDKVLVSH
jgi:chromosome condensin MukBEF ATPase and DNA-binding subunit MukB